MPLIRLDDPADERLADYRHLADPDLAARQGRFIAEGRLVVDRLLAGRRFATRSVLVTEAALAAVRDRLRDRGDLPIYVVPPALIETITGFNIHRGCLAVGERRADEDWRALARDARLVIGLERVSNADNVGAIFRHAAGFGADAVLLDPATVDPLYRKSIRTSMAAALSVPFARAMPWPESLRTLRERGFTIVALTPDGDTALHDALSGVTGPLAILAGHEGEGLSRAALEASTVAASIAMAPGADSLNVATAAAIALYEVRRPRLRQN